jgi:hypothetical protein
VIPSAFSFETTLAAWLDNVDRSSWYGMFSGVGSPAALKIRIALATHC